MTTEAERIAKRHEFVDGAARAAYAAYCAADPAEPREPDWGRDGYKVEAAVWQAVAQAVLRHVGTTLTEPKS